jgi:predicted SnoaL-like aldol condensation-catalyzing enzyme
MIAITRIATALLLAGFSLRAQSSNANKRLVLEFLSGKSDLRAPGYSEHNPRHEAPRADGELIAMVAEKDQILAVYKVIRPDPDKPSATYEAFRSHLLRIEQGKIAEHWDEVKLGAPPLAPAAAKPAAIPRVHSESPATQEANKNLLLEFFRLGADLDARTAMLSEDYTQHNPRFLKMDEVTGLHGRAAWGGAIRVAQGHARLTDTDFSLRSAPVALLAEGDLVGGVYKTTRPDPGDPAKTYEAFNFELVRFSNGSLAEHWDAVTLAPSWRTELEK